MTFYRYGVGDAVVGIASPTFFVGMGEMLTFAETNKKKRTAMSEIQSVAGNHFQRQQLLLRMEYEYEKDEFKRQTEDAGIQRKVARGLCLVSGDGRAELLQLGQSVCRGDIPSGRYGGGACV